MFGPFSFVSIRPSQKQNCTEINIHAIIDSQVLEFEGVRFKHMFYDLCMSYRRLLMHVITMYMQGVLMSVAPHSSSAGVFVVVAIGGVKCSFVSANVL